MPSFVAARPGSVPGRTRGIPNYLVDYAACICRLKEERSKKAEHRVKELEHELSEAVKHGGNNNKSDHHSNSSSSSNNKNNQKVVSDLKTKVKTLEKQRFSSKNTSNKFQRFL